MLFQLYWSGDRDTMLGRLERAKAAGAKGIILTLDWTFGNGRDWGSPWIPEKIDLKTMVKMAPQGLSRPGWLFSFLRRGKLPDLKTPNMALPGSEAPTFFGADYEWMQSDCRDVGRPRLAAQRVGRPLHGQGRVPCR